jgi:hypothetical protein
MAVMAAIVATLVYWPACLALALLFKVLDRSPDTLVTFGGALTTFSGLLAWWLIAFALALAYAAWAFPWDAAQSQENR